MAAVKVNIFISAAPEDKPQLNVLLKWLYPMRDEVNLWYSQPPPPPPELPIPWQILLFWYRASDQRHQYQKILQAQRERSHIYLFLMSYKSLSNKGIEGDIDIAAHRRITGNDFTGPFVFPIVLAPCRWKETSRLAGFKAMAGGKAISAFKLPDEAYLSITEEIATLVKLLQSRLGEEKFYQSRPAEVPANQASETKSSKPYLGETPELLEFHQITPFQPSEWLGWSILLFIFISIINNLMPARPIGPARYDQIQSADDHGWEYRRENPLTPPADTLPFPPAD